MVLQLEKAVSDNELPEESMLNTMDEVFVVID